RANYEQAIVRGPGIQRASFRPDGGVYMQRRRLYSFGSFGGGGGAGGGAAGFFFVSSARRTCFFAGPAGLGRCSAGLGGGSYFCPTSNPIGMLRSRCARRAHGVSGASSTARPRSRVASAAIFFETAPAENFLLGRKIQWLVLLATSPEPNCL